MTHALSAAIGLFCLRRAPPVAVGLALLAGTLVPVLGFVQVGAQAYADRYTYIPYIGLFVAVVYGLAAMGQERPSREARIAGALALVVAVGVLSWQTVGHLGHWRDSTSIWTYTLRQVDVEYDSIAEGNAP